MVMAVSQKPLRYTAIDKKDYFMKRTYYIALLCCLYSFLGAQQGNPLIYLEFDNAMKTKLFDEVLTSEEVNMVDFVGVSNAQLFEFFREQYNKRNFKNAPMAQTPRIPKIIHQIWLGSPVPQQFNKYINSWKNNHPDWEYRLWADDDIVAFGLYNQEMYDEAENYGEKSDIARYEILERFGGVYVDIDFECLQPLDALHHMYDFYIGIQPLDTRYVQVNNALIGSIPGHDI